MIMIMIMIKNKIKIKLTQVDPDLWLWSWSWSWSWSCLDVAYARAPTAGASARDYWENGRDRPAGAQVGGREGARWRIGGCVEFDIT